MDFSSILLNWYDSNKRDLPWRKTKDPYIIWISEIILQQTRVNQGLPYFLRFIDAFPSIASLASAKEEKVLKLWQGLGYYSRARNLHFSAKYIVKYHNGYFPSDYKDILALKGVGEYTAAAISSFAFNLPYAVVDGNVIRVLSRVFGIDLPFDTVSSKRKYQQLAQDLLSGEKHACYNQAIMDFGALYCTPNNPKCILCPFAVNCIAYNTNNIEGFPIKKKKIKVQDRFIHYFVIKNLDYILLGKRGVGVWEGLYEFPYIEFQTKRSESSVMKSKKWNQFFENKEYKIVTVSEELIHRLTHQNIYAKFWIVNIKEVKLENYNFIVKEKIKDLPVSRLIDKFLKGYNMI